MLRLPHPALHPLRSVFVTFHPSKTMTRTAFVLLGTTLISALPLFAQAPAGTPTAEQMAEGRKVYMTCMPCHQPTGLGLPPVFPPLAKTEYVNGSAERFAAMILKGNAGPMTIDGKVYNNIMPGQEATLNDNQVAAVMTYVRNSFGNNAPAVTPDVVAATRKKFADRKTPWTEPELKAWKDDAAPAAGGATAPATGAASAPAAPAPAQ
jgi:mono/diheme cytochrome c family protein